MAEAMQLGGNAEAARVNLFYPVHTLGSHKEWMGQPEHATYGIPFESYMSNTGDFLVDGKGDGQ
jgi:hypothetical protein